MLENPPTDHERRQVLRAGMAAASVDLIALWATYVALGGHLGADAVGRYLVGEGLLEEEDVLLLTSALEDRLKRSR